MPIFEYLCEECGNRFERLVLRPGMETLACPACGGAQVTQQVSAFLSPVAGKHKPAPRQHSEYPDGLIAPHDD
ncbi:MAG TPA: zinc ribbon domain-containing protein [Bryobacteraceae bacterium]|nr:zinc ribbon domain-containing protein [Bryobacteraceae bacterium]